VFREDIALKSTEQAYITSIDASALQTEASSSGTKGTFSVKYADGRIQPASDPSKVPVDPPQKQVILRYDRTAGVQPLAGCKQAPLATIRRLAFVWPASNPSINMMATVVIGDAVVLPVPFTIERKDATVKAIVVPANSLFTASEELKIENDGKTDRLSKKDSGVKISGLSPDSDFWMEFLENRWLLRNSLVYPHRDYLVAENAIAAVLSVLIGLAGGWLLPKMPEGKERKEG
jgi:hypothetical protein